MSGKKNVKTVKYTLDCSIPVSDDVLDTKNFQEFLEKRVKVEGKKLNLAAGNVSIEHDGHNVIVTANAPFSKRQLKYLTKKFLKKVDLRDYLRVVASDAQTYQLRYFNLSGGDDEEDEDDE